MLRLTLPLPPSANRYWRSANGHVYVSEEAKAYKTEVQYAWFEEPKCFFIEHVSVTLRIFQARKSGDLDNRVKVLLDALRGLVYQDDSQVVELHAFRGDDKANPRVEVEIREVA